MTDLAPFLLTALALVGSPGPNTLSLAATGAAFGGKAGLAYMLGLNLGMVAVIAITATGLAGLVMALPGVEPVVTVLAAGYFLFLAWRIATAPPRTRIDAIGGQAPRWYEGAALSLVNPKAYAAMAALFSGHSLIAERPVADVAVKVVLALGLIVAVNLDWLNLGARMTDMLANPQTVRRVNIAFAAALLLSVLLVALS